MPRQAQDGVEQRDAEESKFPLCFLRSRRFFRCIPPYVSHLKGTRVRHFFRRFLQTSGKALGARAELAQVVKSVNAGIVAVAPAETQGIVTHRRNIHPLQGGRNASVEDFSHPREFLDTGGAHAILPQVPRRIRAEMAVVPSNIRLPGTDTFYTRRG
jgi:hypothetical protein